VAKSKSKVSKPGKSGRTAENQSKEFDDLERLFELMEKHDIAEFEWERQGERFKFKTTQAVADRGFAGLGSAVLAGASGALAPRVDLVDHHREPQAAQAKVVQAAPGAAVSTSQKQVVSPFVGTFYRAASPESDPYVRDGQTVKRGDVLCIVEAMKLMNEIEAEFSGKIISVLVENGQPVEFGEPLFILEP
jgi:acetyl-CoA carboxylase biotin carboxyl carrier protein